MIPARFRPRFDAVLLAVCCAAHLLLAASFHLSTDEAHYALYALHLDWSYYDHPPLVGWLQWPALQLGGGDVAMRLVPMLCWLATAIGIRSLTRQLVGGAAGERAASVALLVFALSPIHHLLGIALVPDSLLMPLTCAAMLFTLRLRRDADGGRDRDWLGLGATLGLAGLAKYSAIYLPLGVALLLLPVHGSRLLHRRGPWLAAALALVLVTPVFAWNAAHGWASLAYQMHHAAGSEHWLARRVIVFALVQLIGFGPLLVIGAWTGGGRDAALRDLRWFAAAFGLPLLLTLAYASGRGSTLPHWSAFAWVAACPAAAAAYVAWRDGGRAGRTAVRGMVALQLGLCLLAAGLIFTAGTVSEAGAQAQSAPGQMADTAPLNPFADLWGWDDAAQEAARLARRYDVPALAVVNWSLAARIAWYARPLPVRIVKHRSDQFDYWFGTLHRGDSVILIDWSLLSFAPPVGPQQFAHCEPVGTLPVMRFGRQVAHFNYLLCTNWSGAEGGE